jgi:hypothetical protein
MAFVLEVSDLNSQAIEAVLDDVLFYIVLDWNASGEYWGMAIRNSAYAILIDGIAVVPNYPLLYQFRYEDTPAGSIVAAPVSGKMTNGNIPRDGFVSGKYQLVYYTEQDLIDMGALETFGRTYAYAI